MGAHIPEVDSWVPPHGSVKPGPWHRYHRGWILGVLAPSLTSQDPESWNLQLGNPRKWLESAHSQTRGNQAGKQQPLSLPSFHLKMSSHNYPGVSISNFRVTRQQALAFQQTSQELCFLHSVLPLCGHSTRKTSSANGQEEAWPESQRTKSLAAGRAPGAVQNAQIYGWMEGWMDGWTDE